MILSDYTIRYCIDHGHIEISDFDEKWLQKDSYVFHLDDKLWFYKDAVIDPYKSNDDTMMGCFTIPPEGFVVVPGAFYLGHTKEHLKCEKCVPVASETPKMAFCGVSTIGSQHLMVKGHDEPISLQIRCAQPVRLYPGMDICVVRFHTTSSMSLVEEE